MKKTRRLLCLLLTVVLALSLCAIPAAAADDQTRSDDPVVFVHGLLGWGQRDRIYRIMPYWGMTTGSLTDYLSAKGYETYAASVGPLSSAWDRACELYAQLAGTRTDYGVKHAQDFGHERYGIDYAQPLFDGWGTKRAVNPSATASAARPRASSLRSSPTAARRRSPQPKPPVSSRARFSSAARAAGCTR